MHAPRTNILHLTNLEVQWYCGCQDQSHLVLLLMLPVSSCKALAYIYHSISRINIPEHCSSPWRLRSSVNGLQSPMCQDQAVLKPRHVGRSALINKFTVSPSMSFAAIFLSSQLPFSYLNVCIKHPHPPRDALSLSSYVRFLLVCSAYHTFDGVPKSLSDNERRTRLNWW